MENRTKVDIFIQTLKEYFTKQCEVNIQVFQTDYNNFLIVLDKNNIKLNKFQIKFLSKGIFGLLVQQQQVTKIQRFSINEFTEYVLTVDYKHIQ
jgi:hypothetical protein